MSFDAKTILVTGAASGIGLATARLLAAGGAARLLLVDREAEALEAVDLDCEVVRIAGDVADPNLWQRASIHYLDHAVINAGIAGVAPIADLPFAEWRRVLSANLDGAFLTLQAALRAMRDGGSIVCVASAAGFKPEPGIGAYAASKAGLIQLARVAAKEQAGRRVRINAIAPGGTETPMWEGPDFNARVAAVGRDAAFAEIAARSTPLGRFAKPEEIAAHIAFLLSDDAAFTTGATLVSDGGYTL